MTPIFFSKRNYALAVGILCLLFAATLYHRIAHFDDAWFAEQSYWVLKEGIARSEFFRGYNYWHERLYVFHKAFVYAQVPALYMFGSSIWAARAIPMLFSVTGLLLLLRYFLLQPEQQWLAAVLYLGCGCLWLFGVDSRPETMTMSFGFASFLLLNRASWSTKHVVAAGILAGVAGLTHLNGIIYVAAGALWLLSRAGWKTASWFGVAGGLTLSLYLADAVADQRLDRLLYQFSHDYVVQSNLHWWSKLSVMATYDRLFFHSDGETPLTVLLLVLILVLACRRQTRQLFTPSTQYLLLLLGLFWVLTKSNSAYYFLLFVPFIIVVAVELVFAAAANLARWQYQVIVAIFSLYPLGGVARARYLVLENRTDGPVMVENARLATYMPQHGAKVIAPLDFFFGQISNYQLQSLTYYALVDPSQQQPVSTFFAAAARQGVQYIICDYRTWNQAYQIPRTAPYRIGPYQLVFQGKWRGVYVYRGNATSIAK